MTGSTILRGSYPWPVITEVSAPNDQPDVDTPLAARILTPAPCGYFISEAEYTKDRPSEADEDVMAGSVAQRLAIHGIKVEPAPGGVFVPLRQRLRGLIAPILDSQAVLPMLTTAERRFCFREDAAGRRQRAGDAVAGGRRAGDVRAVRAGRRSQLRRVDDGQRDLERR